MVAQRTARCAATRSASRSGARRPGIAIGAVSVGLAAAIGCGGSNIELCGQIPADGCPIGRGGTCDDPTCGALYDCVDGAWTRVEACAAVPQGGQGGSAGEGTGGSGGAGAAGGCAVVELDHTGETQGCQPDLQEPDCPAVAAEVCLPCTTGCSDFFMCLPIGWVDVAYCTEEGELIVFSR